MKDTDKTKEELINELGLLRNRITQLEASEIEYKRTEQELRQTENNYRILFETGIDGVIIIDGETKRVVLCNQTAAKIYGFNSREEVIGLDPFSLMHPRDKERLVKIILQDGFKKDLREVNEFRQITKDGRELWVSAVGAISKYQGKQVMMVSLRDITEHKRTEEELKRSAEKLLKAMEDTIQAMAVTVEMRDPYTAGHQRRVSQLAIAIARQTGLSEDRISGLRLAGLIHDIGKTRVPAEILTNPGKLSEAEFSIIKMHPAVGYDILKDIEFPWPIAQIVYQHHEMMDGSGYPSGLSGDEIIAESRIMAVADVVEAMSSHRPYRPALGIDKALLEILQKKESLYEPEAVDACLEIFSNNEFEFA